MTSVNWSQSNTPTISSAFLTFSSISNNLVLLTCNAAVWKLPRVREQWTRASLTHMSLRFILVLISCKEFIIAHWAFVWILDKLRFYFLCFWDVAVHRSRSKMASRKWKGPVLPQNIIFMFQGEMIMQILEGPACIMSMKCCQCL